MNDPKKAVPLIALALTSVLNLAACGSTNAGAGSGPSTSPAMMEHSPSPSGAMMEHSPSPKP